MKTSTKIIILLVLLLVGAIWYGSYLYKKAEEHSVKESKNPIAQLKKKEVETEATKISQDVKKDGLQHTIYKMVKEIDQSAVDKVKADLMDTVDKLNIARDKLRQIIVVAATLKIENQKLERQIGALATTYSHTDNNFRLSVNVPNDTAQVATFNAGYDAELMNAQYDKSKWLIFSERYMDIYSNDRRFTIQGARTMTIKQTPSPFAVSVDAGGHYNPITGVSAGPSLKLRLGNLSIKGDYQYYLPDQKWSWGAGASYKIVGSN